MNARSYYNEIDKFCAQWLRNLIAAGHIAPGDVDERSIADVRASDLAGYTQCHFFAGIGIWSAALRQSGWEDSRSVWTGSCPCQPLSAAGKRLGAEDDRHLWPVWFELIKLCRPVAVFGEQVASKDGLAWLDIVQSDLENADYASGAVDLCAAGFGAPHIRQRLFFMAYAPSNRGGDGQSKQIGRPAEFPKTHSVNGELAHPNGRDTGTEGLQRSGQHGLQPQDGGAVRVAQPDEGQRRPGRAAPGGARGPQPKFAGSSAAGELGNTGGPRLSQRERDGRLQREAMESPPRETAERGSDIGELGHAPRDGRIEGRPEPARQQGRPDAAEPSATNGFWADAEWIACTDGKTRPVEAGTFPLAHGDTGRVGKMRAYGNAMDNQEAAAFCAAVREALD